MSGSLAWLTVLYGVINSIAIHLSKAMQDHGIRLFKKNRDRVIERGYTYSFAHDMRGLFSKKSHIYMWIYLIGVILNQTPIIWGTIATRYGRAPYFTSVFPLGMLVLFIYSKKVMHDHIPKLQLYGITAILAGTVLIGLENILKPYRSNELNYNAAWIVICIFFFFALVGIFISTKIGTPALIGIVFGAIGGVMGSLDPILKDISQEYGVSQISQVSSFFPITTMGWIIFLISLLMGSFSFFITQWAYSLDAKAPLMISFYNTFYLSFPVLLYLIIDSTYHMTILSLFGLFLNIIGVVIISRHVVAVHRERQVHLIRIPVEIPNIE
ncbi:MAG: hypothetical protein K9W44_00995 [Candidatus Lokiarchaeota archaeon]|nr:hypothetical protein [Candidatus Harpocratesius repetitus]